jgi:hypothetical protein
MPRITFNDLSTVNQNRLKSWNNQFKLNIDIKSSLAWVKTKEQKIADGIENHIQTTGKNVGKTYSTTTKRDYYNLLAQILENQGQKNKAKVYRKFVNDLNALHNAVEDDQELDEFELRNWTSHGELLQKLSELKGNYKKNPNKSNGYRYLGLALYTLHPPIRNNYYNMRIAPDDKNQSQLLKSKTINYLHKTNSGYNVILNKDKVSNKRGSSIIPIDNKEVIAIIDESLERFPRKYLFTLISNVKKPMSKEYFGNTLIKTLFDGKNTGINNFRSSYVSWFYGKGPTLKAKKKLAEQMRHSHTIAEQAYNKLKTVDEVVGDTLDDNGFADEEESEDDDDVTVPTKKVVERPLRATFDLKAWNKTYRKKNKEMYQQSSKKYYDRNKKEVLKRKILKNVNSGNTDRPSDTSIRLYNLEYDDKTKQWRERKV